jgi:hypothetical protein
MAIMGPVGGQRLGGSTSGGVSKVDSSGRRMTPGEMAVMAAERRRLDSIWCGAIEDEQEQEKTNSGGEAIINRIGLELEIDDSDDDDVIIVAHNQGCDHDEQGVRHVGDDSLLLPGLSQPPQSWICRECTLANDFGTLCCEVCTAPRNLTQPSSLSSSPFRLPSLPAASAATPSLAVPPQAPILQKSPCKHHRDDGAGASSAWTCTHCTLENDVASHPSFCDACGNARVDAIQADAAVGHASSSTTSAWECSACSLLNEKIQPRCEACDGLAPLARLGIDGELIYDGLWQCIKCVSWTDASFRMCSGCGFVRRM